MTTRKNLAHRPGPPTYLDLRTQFGWLSSPNKISPADLAGLIDHIITLPNTILEIAPYMFGGKPFSNPPYSTTSPSWASDQVGGQTFPDNSTPVWEWNPVLNPGNELDDSVGVSGVALSPQISKNDNWFYHPFGFDYEFYIAVDPQYTQQGNSVLSVTNNGIDIFHNNNSDTEYSAATKEANEDLGLMIPGVLGVEWDSGLVPQDYRAQDLDRVVVFGRWIVDAGHPDFHTEIHPPLLLAVARPLSDTATRSTLIGRPFLVSQQFSNGALREHFIKEIEAVAIPAIFTGIPGSLRVEAHPKVFTTPFSGVKLYNYLVRTPYKRKSAKDELRMRFHFTVRTGIAIQLYQFDDDTIGVLVLMIDTDYKPPALPTRHDATVSLAELMAYPPLASLLNDIMGSSFVAGFAGGAVNWVLNKGILTDAYDIPTASSQFDQNIRAFSASALNKNNPHFDVDDSQPFPVYGFLEVYWFDTDILAEIPHPPNPVP